MMTYTDATEKRTDPRRPYIFLGVDTEGGHHVYHTRSESIYSIEDGDIAYHESLDGRSVNVFMEYIAERRGWADRRMFDTLAGGLGGNITIEEAE